MVYAGFSSRFLSNLIDILVVLPVTAVSLWLQSISRDVGLALLIPTSFFYLVYTVFMHARWGQTLGKMVLKIRVVQPDGSPILAKQALLRNSVDLVFTLIVVYFNLTAILGITPEEYVSLDFMSRIKRIQSLQPSSTQILMILEQVWFWSELIVLLFNKKRRAIHDFIAGTVVIHTELKIGENPPRYQHVLAVGLLASLALLPILVTCSIFYFALQSSKGSFDQYTYTVRCEFSPDGKLAAGMFIYGDYNAPSRIALRVGPIVNNAVSDRCKPIAEKPPVAAWEREAKNIPSGITGYGLGIRWEQDSKHLEFFHSGQNGMHTVLYNGDASNLQQP